MKAFKLLAVSLAFGLTFGAGMATAQADGVALKQKQLDQKQRQTLITAVAQARVQNPAAFKSVERVAGVVEELDKKKRGRFATITPHLNAIGSQALLPMLEMLALNGPARGKMKDTAWTTLRVGLIEAVGVKRDPVAIPVLDAILQHETDYWVVRASAEALGRIGDDASAKKLVGLAITSGPKQSAVLSAIGDCRRAVVVAGLRDFLKSPTDFETTKLALKALGGAGNSWAWQTPAVNKTGEQAEVRGNAAKALVDAFVRFEDPQLRLTAQKAILLVDDPATPALIEAAKSGASAETRAALDALAKKFSRNPLHR